MELTHSNSVLRTMSWFLEPENCWITAFGDSTWTYKNKKLFNNLIDKDNNNNNNNNNNSNNNSNNNESTTVKCRTIPEGTKILHERSHNHVTPLVERATC